MSSPVQVANPPSPTASSTNKRPKADLTFGDWLESLLLPPNACAANKRAAEISPEKDTPSKGNDPFCNIPELMKINFCCAETVQTTKADDQSHSTISEENNQENEVAAEKPKTVSSFQTWEAFFADWNTKLCGKPFVDGLPPTIDIASPINRGSSAATADEKLRLSDKADETPDETPKEIVVSTAEPKDEPKPDAETNPEENDAIVNETIVIYYSDSGSTDGKDEDAGNINEANATTSPAPTVVRVELDPFKQDMDDAILQERARAEASKTPDVSLSNTEAESTGAIAPNPVRFQNLATGSFCEISVGDEDAPVANEEGLLAKSASVDLPLVEEEEVETDSNTEPEPVQENQDQKELEKEPEAETLVNNEVVDTEEPVATSEETSEGDAPQADLKVVAVLDIESEEEQIAEEVKAIEEDSEENKDTEGTLEEKDFNETITAAEEPAENDVKEPSNECHSEPEVPQVESEPVPSPEPTLAVESTETTVKMVSLLVGVFDSTDGPH